jgi:hypothetical protein
MDLLQMVLAATQNNAVDKLASQHNLSSNQASDVLSQLLPELGSRIQGNIKQENGLESLINALGKGNHQRFVDEDSVLDDPNTEMEGNRILGHLLGDKDTSRQVASQVESNTGVSASIIKKLLPMAATLLMGTMSKGAQSSGLLDNLVNSNDGQNDLLGSVIGSMLGGGSSTGNQTDAGDIVGGLLKSFLK